MPDAIPTWPLPDDLLAELQNLPGEMPQDFQSWMNILQAELAAEATPQVAAPTAVES